MIHTLMHRAKFKFDSGLEVRLLKVVEIVDEIGPWSNGGLTCSQLVDLDLVEQPLGARCRGVQLQKCPAVLTRAAPFLLIHQQPGDGDADVGVARVGLAGGDQRLLRRKSKGVVQLQAARCVSPCRTSWYKTPLPLGDATIVEP